MFVRKMKIPCGGGSAILLKQDPGRVSHEIFIRCKVCFPYGNSLILSNVPDGNFSSEPADGACLSVCPDKRIARTAGSVFKGPNPTGGYSV
jgi:hypothetical protein